MMKLDSLSLLLTVACAGLLTSAHQPATPPPHDASLRVFGHVKNPLRLSLSELRDNFTPRVVEARYLREVKVVRGVFTGVLLWDILRSAQPVIQEHATDDQLSIYITAMGSDGFQVAFSWAEIDPDFGNQQVIVAYARDGLSIREPRGALRLVVPGDLRGGRYVAGLTQLCVSHLPPAPHG